MMRGQFFSFDVLAGAFIFIIAFFLLAFYWLNAQALFAQQELGDTQREAERVADQLTTVGPGGDWYETYENHPQKNDRSKLLDYYYEVDYIHLVSDASTPNEIGVDLMKDLNAMSGVDNGRFYPGVKEKLGIPRYEVYITIENSGGTVLSCQYSRPGLSGPFDCEAGRDPTAEGSGAMEIANAERIVLIDRNPGDSAPHELAKLRVQVWR